MSQQKPQNNLEGCIQAGQRTGTFTDIAEE